MEFRYLQLHLIHKDWRRFIDSNNPAAAALLSKMGYTTKERVQVKLEFLRMISRMELTPAKMGLLYGFFDAYLQLNDEEEKQMQEKVSNLPKEEAERVLELPNYYFEKGVEKGLKKGKEEEIVRVVFNMFTSGFSDEVIVEITGLSGSRVEEIKKRWREEN